MTPGPFNFTVTKSQLVDNINLNHVTKFPHSRIKTRLEKINSVAIAGMTR